MGSHRILRRAALAVVVLALGACDLPEHPGLPTTTSSSTTSSTTTTTVPLPDPVFVNGDAYEQDWGQPALIDVLGNDHLPAGRAITVVVLRQAVFGEITVTSELNAAGRPYLQYAPNKRFFVGNDGGAYAVHDAVTGALLDYGPIGLFVEEVTPMPTERTVARARPPLTVTNGASTALAGAGEVSLTWPATPAIDASKYEVDVYDGSSLRRITMATGEVLSTTVTGLTPGTPYWFRIRREVSDQLSPRFTPSPATGPIVPT